MIRVFRFMWALIKYVLFGSTVNTEVYQNRLSKCNSCVHLKDTVCDLCECIVKQKAKWSTESCPKKEW